MFRPSSQTLSQKQAESFISEQAARLQNKDPTALPPNLLQEQISTVSERNPHLAEVVCLYGSVGKCPSITGVRISLCG